MRKRFLYFRIWEGLMSQERAAMAAGLDRTDFRRALAREKVDAFPVDLAPLAREIAREWAAGRRPL